MSYDVNDKFPDGDEKHGIIIDSGDYIHKHLVAAETTARKKLSNIRKGNKQSPQEITLKILARLRYAILEEV